MYRKQLGRRNLTEAQRAVLIGRMYTARKHSHGAADGFRGNQSVSAQNEHIPSKPNRTAEQIAEELGIGKETVKRAEKFANGIDTLREVSEEAADKVLQGGSGAAKSVIMTLPEMSQEQKSEVADSIVSGNIKKKTSGLTSTGWTKKDRSSREETNAIVADMYDPSTVPEYTAEDLVKDINGPTF